MSHFVLLYFRAQPPCSILFTYLKVGHGMDLSFSGNNYSQTWDFFVGIGQLSDILSQGDKIKDVGPNFYVIFREKEKKLFYSMREAYGESLFVRLYCYAHSKVWKDERKWFILVSLNF